MTQTAQHAGAGDSSDSSKSAHKPSRSQRRRDRRKFAQQRAREGHSSDHRTSEGQRGFSESSNRTTGSRTHNAQRGFSESSNRTAGSRTHNAQQGNSESNAERTARPGRRYPDTATPRPTAPQHRTPRDHYDAPNLKGTIEPHPANASLHTRRGDTAATPRRHGVIPSVEEAPFAAVSIRFARMHPTTGRMHAFAVSFLNTEGKVVSTWSTLLRTESSPGPAHLFGASPRDFDHAPEFVDVVDAVDHTCHKRIIFLHRTDITWGYLVNEARRARARQMPRPSKGQSRWSVLKLKKMVPKPRVLMDTLETARRQGLILPDARLRGVASLYGLVQAPSGAEGGNVFSEVTEIFPDATAVDNSPYRDDTETLTFAALQRIPGMGTPGHQRGEIAMNTSDDTLPQVGPRASDYRRVGNPLEALQADANLTAALAVAQLAREGRTLQDLLDHADALDAQRVDASHTHEWSSTQALDFAELRTAPNGKLIPRTFSGNCAGGEDFVNFALRTPQELRADRYGIQRTRTKLHAQMLHAPLEPPPTWHEGEPLQPGMIVCIAPEIDIDPDLVVAAAQAAGLHYTEKLLRETALVVCDGPTDAHGNLSPQQGAAMHAFRKGIPLVRASEFFPLAEELAHRRTAAAHSHRRGHTRRGGRNR